MKINYCLIIFSLLSFSAITEIAAQTTAPYVFFKPIFAFPANTSKLYETTATIQGTDYTKGVYGSFGRGFCFQAGVGKMINSTFGFEVGAEMLLGKKINSSISDDAGIGGQASGAVNAVLLKPVLVLRNSGDLLSIYSKLGLAISVYSKRYENANVQIVADSNSFLATVSSVEDIKAKVGFTAAFGLSFRVSQAVAISGEINGQMISLPVHQGHYTKYFINGQDKLPSLTVAQKQWTYVKSGALGITDPNKPEVRLFDPANFSYIGVSIGITYYF